MKDYAREEPNKRFKDNFEKLNHFYILRLNIRKITETTQTWSIISATFLLITPSVHLCLSSLIDHFYESINWLDEFDISSIIRRE